MLRRILAMGSALSLLVGCVGTPSQITQAPPRLASPITPGDDEVSTIILATSIPYAQIRSRIDAQLPASTPFSGQNDRCLCVSVPAATTYQDSLGLTWPTIGSRQACMQCNWHGSVNKVGGVQLGNVNNRLRVSQGFTVSGQAGINGDLARLLALSGENFHMDLQPVFDVSADLNADWCPTVHVDVQPNWARDANIEIVGRNCVGINLGPLGNPQACAGPVNIEVTGQVNNAIQDNLNSLSTSISQSLSCETMRSKALGGFKTMSIPLQLPQGDRLYFNITPVGAGFQGLNLENDALKTAFSLKARTTVDSKPLVEAPVPLPALQRIQAQGSSISLHVPFRLPYDLIEKNLGAEVVGKHFAKDKADILVKSIKVYPTGSSITVGLEVDAKLPGRILNVAGWIYALGKPTVINNGTAIKFDNLDYTTALDNQIWSAASVIFKGPILNSLKARSTVDLTQSIKQYEASITKQIRDAKISGVSLNPRDAHLALDQVALEPDNLIVKMHLTSVLDLSLTGIANWASEVTPSMSRSA